MLLIGYGRRLRQVNRAKEALVAGVVPCNKARLQNSSEGRKIAFTSAVHTLLPFSFGFHKPQALFYHRDCTESQPKSLLPKEVCKQLCSRILYNSVLHGVHQNPGSFLGILVHFPIQGTLGYHTLLLVLQADSTMYCSGYDSYKSEIYFSFMLFIILELTVSRHGFRLCLLTSLLELPWVAQFRDLSYLY